MATIQIINAETKTLIKQMVGDVMPDGRIKMQTTKGKGFLVCGEAAKDAGIDPLSAVFDENAGAAHYRINQPIFGKIVKAWESTGCEYEINVDWLTFQGINENGEGYNPYPQYILTKESSTRYL